MTDTTTSSYAATLRETLPRVRERLARAAEEAGRDPEEVTLVAVTKGHSLEAVEAALEAGLTELGENRIGELESKVARVDDPRVRWHMIGHLQRRKAPRAIEVMDLIHSVDSVRLAERLSRVAVAAEEEDGRPREVRLLFQVNTSGEDAKYGFEPDRALDEILEVAELPSLVPRGLMTMAPFTDDEAVHHRTFRRLRELSEALRAELPSMGAELSMGMTNDLEAAVAEGSTMVRIGTALFGERPG